MAQQQPPLTFGIELEFICLRRTSHFAPLYTSSADTGSVGPAIFSHLLRTGIPATGWEDLDDDIAMDAPSHSRWRVETDELELSEEEDALLPDGWEAEAVELISRKFDFFADDWRAEIQAVLNVLRDVETQYGVRFIANQSTGFHVHVGNGGEKVPLRTAKNVFQLITSFERCLDEVHAVPRIEVPGYVNCSHAYYPPSFFHIQGMRGEPSGLFERLAKIETIRSYEELGRFFNIHCPELGQYLTTTGHNSAYNFDNLFPDPDNDRYEETLTGTIEFRQHTGTLDYLDIAAWVLVVCQLVQYSTEKNDLNMLELCARGADTNFGLADLLAHLGCCRDIIEHYTQQNMIGIIGDERTSLNNTPSPVDDLIAQNDAECADRSDRGAVMAAIDGKFTGGQYGLDPETRGVLPSDAALAELQAAQITANMVGANVSVEDGRSVVRGEVFRALGERYRNLR